jgi:hypothetical protein
MEIEAHPEFDVPEDDDIIWRYMDFTKFIHMLDSKALYFNRIDQFKDTFEGTVSIYNKSNREKMLYSRLQPHVAEHLAKVYAELDSTVNLADRKQIFINCWHINEFESAAMWDLYNKNGEGIAIKSTYGNLKKCFIEENEALIIGKVKYLDYNSEWMPEGNSFHKIFHKRKSFLHENELRISYQDFSLKLHTDGSEESPVKGMYFKVDLNCLINQVYISPDSPKWVSDLITSLSIKYGLSAEVVKSNLYEIN